MFLHAHTHLQNNQVTRPGVGDVRIEQIDFGWEEKLAKLWLTAMMSSAPIEWVKRSATIPH